MRSKKNKVKKSFRRSYKNKSRAKKTRISKRSKKVKRSKRDKRYKRVKRNSMKGGTARAKDPKGEPEIGPTVGQKCGKMA